MKRLLVVGLILFSGIIHAQFRGQEDKPVDVKGSLINDNPSSLFMGFFNPDNLQIKHSLNMSYTTFGNQGIALGVYTGSVSYKFSETLDLEVDASIVNSPYSSFGAGHAEQINGVYISRARLNYRPSEDVSIIVQFNRVPYGYYQPYYRTSPFYMTGRGDGSPFEN